jgi:hypothetical protein
MIWSLLNQIIVIKYIILKLSNENSNLTKACILSKFPISFLKKMHNICFVLIQDMHLQRYGKIYILMHLQFVFKKKNESWHSFIYSGLHIMWHSSNPLTLQIIKYDTYNVKFANPLIDKEQYLKVVSTWKKKFTAPNI